MGSKKDAPLAVIKEPTTTLSLSFREMQILENHCNILKDFVFTPLANGRKLHKNSKILSEKQQEIADEGQRIEERRAKLHEFLADPKATSESKAETDELMKDLIAETKAFNIRKSEVNIYTLLVSDYPNDPEKFGKKSIPQNNAPAIEVAYYPSFLELTDQIILD